MEFKLKETSGRISTDGTKVYINTLGQDGITAIYHL
jgi:hypothetical protein